MSFDRGENALHFTSVDMFNQIETSPEKLDGNRSIFEENSGKTVKLLSPLDIFLSLEVRFVLLLCVMCTLHLTAAPNVLFFFHHRNASERNTSNYGQTKMPAHDRLTRVPSAGWGAEENCTNLMRFTRFRRPCASGGAFSHSADEIIRLAPSLQLSADGRQM